MADLARRRNLVVWAKALACLALASSACAAAPVGPAWPSGLSSANMIVVAVEEKPDPGLGAGATPRGYSGLGSYAGGSHAVAASSRLSKQYALREVSAWTIATLQLRCMVFELAAGVDRDDVLQRLAQDRRVRIAQPLQEFETFSSAPAESVAAGTAVYNDPYIGLQHNFAAIEAAAAQRWTRGDGLQIAIVDTGLDANHPDLAGRIIGQRDLVGAAPGQSIAERHGTEVAGVIAAVANNNLGIVGVAPDAQLYSYRACWPLSENASAARCNSFTLALALSAAIASDARIINLSLGGPRDPLLEQLLGVALKRGTIVVGAVPPSGRMDGFPVGVSGVIAVDAAEDSPHQSASLRAPGHDILTTEPGGHFDYASGSSLAAAHVSGAIALLLALKPKQNSASLYALLSHSQAHAGSAIDVCHAMAALQAGARNCDAKPDQTPRPAED